MKYDLAIIGGGVTGSAIAREASKYKLKTILIEKEPDVAEGISKANSGVLHAGFNVRPDSLKARFNVEGLKLCPVIAEELNVDYRITKKLVVGNSSDDLKYLKKLLEQGRQNSCSGLSIIGRDEILKHEPLAKAKWALLSESTGIICPFSFTIALAESAAKNGVEFRLNTEVTDITPINGEGFRINTRKTTLPQKTNTKAAADPAPTSAAETNIDCRFLINAAGMNSARIKSMVETHNVEIYPCRGEYYVTDKECGSLLSMPIYPVPPADGSGLGVHLTPTTNGNILIGPSADYLDDGEDLANTADVMAQLKKEAFELMPQLKESSFIKNYSGMRPKLFTKESGKVFADFIIEESEQFPGMINLMGIESPGLTSAPAIAKYVIEELVGSKCYLYEDHTYNPQPNPIIRTQKLDDRQFEALAASAPAYNEIICRCEQVSRAEIIQAINNPLGALSLSAVKKRTYAMMGRCQSGFCLPRIIDIIHEETDLQPEKIVKSIGGSYILSGRIK